MNNSEPPNTDILCCCLCMDADDIQNKIWNTSIDKVDPVLGKLIMSAQQALLKYDYVIITAVFAELMLILISILTGQILQLSFPVISILTWLLLTCKCPFTRQIHNWLKKISKKLTWLTQGAKWIFLLFFVPFCTSLNTAPAILVMVDWLNHSVCVFNVTYLLNIEMVDNITNRIPAIALRDVNSLNDVQVIDNMSQSEIFTKLVILLFAISSCLSFNMFILALCCTYKCKWLRKCTRSRDVQVNQLNVKPLDAFYVTRDELLTRQNECEQQQQLPLEEQLKKQLKVKLEGLQGSLTQNQRLIEQQIQQQLKKPNIMQQQLQQLQKALKKLDQQAENLDQLTQLLQQVLELLEQTTSTTLHLPESLYFILLWLLNIGLWSLGVGLFVTWHYYKHDYYMSTSNLSYDWEVAGFSMYMYSLFCTIASCFIFSKLAYSVAERCLKLGNSMIVALNNNNNVDFPSLMEADDNFTQQAQATLNWFEYWFTVHWVFYTVTSYLSITLFLNMLLRYIQAGLNTPPDSAVGFSHEELWITGIFTLSHCLLFLYPCFKAATVTLSRETMIKKVSKNLQNVERGTIEQIFIQYLKNKKYGFRISFFCARLRFSFNVAYISIFIGLLGVLTKITGVL